MLTIGRGGRILPPMNESLGENLKRLRVKAGLGRERLANLCEPPMVGQTVRNIESGKTADPGVHTMDALCRVLNVTRKKMLGALHG